jgi:hypothetical protein
MCPRAPPVAPPAHTSQRATTTVRAERAPSWSLPLLLLLRASAPHPLGPCPPPRRRQRCAPFLRLAAPPRLGRLLMCTSARISTHTAGRDQRERPSDRLASSSPPFYAPALSALYSRPSFLPAHSLEVGCGAASSVQCYHRGRATGTSLCALVAWSHPRPHTRQESGALLPVACRAAAPTRRRFTAISYRLEMVRGI